jgi:23S rRNA (guanine745-N1)-methyltransferase
LVCTSGHSFDIARQGYANLLPGDARPGTADTPEMVQARAEFLAAGHFSPLAEALALECAVRVGGLPEGAPVVDIGAGTGYYLAAVLASLSGRAGIALDISKHAARRAARAHRRMAAVVCDAWGPLPMRAGAASAVLGVFSPRNASETRRILDPGGVFLLVTPTSEHLAELVPILGLLDVDEGKEERVEEQLGGHFRLETREELAIPLRLSHSDLERLVGMGPSARHTDPSRTARQVAELPEWTPATAALALSVYLPVT